MPEHSLSGMLRLSQYPQSVLVSDHIYPIDENDRTEGCLPLPCTPTDVPGRSPCLNPKTGYAVTPESPATHQKALHIPMIHRMVDLTALC